MIPFILHTANRNIKNEEKEVQDAFYKIKDAILKRWGKVLGYDVPEGSEWEVLNDVTCKDQ